LLGIAKAYGAIEVLHGVDLRVRVGSIHALVGANGAGKSTLLKVAVGATAATAGRVLVNSHERHFASPFEARKAGIGMVFQERSLVPELSTVDNIFLNGEAKRVGLIRGPPHSSPGSKQSRFSMTPTPQSVGKEASARFRFY
jgi:ABC-type sugar transport system ATPase subunit